MSGNNDSTTESLITGFVLMVIGFVAAIIYYAVMFAMLAVAFLSAFMTVLALFAVLFNGITFAGEHFSRSEAAAFIGRGLVYAVVVPTFYAFASIFVDVYQSDQLWGYMIFGSYAFGSVGIEILEGINEENARSASVPQTILPPAEAESRAVAARLINRPGTDHLKEPFGFASWDDEDRAA